MANKLYVGSLPYGVDDNKLKELFAEFGSVVSAQVIMDRDSNQSKGFGFVEMTTEAEAQAAIKALNGKDLDGRSIVVNEARPKEHAGSGFDRGRRSF